MTVAALARAATLLQALLSEKDSIFLATHNHIKDYITGKDSNATLAISLHNASLTSYLLRASATTTRQALALQQLQAMDHTQPVIAPCCVCTYPVAAPPANQPHLGTTRWLLCQFIISTLLAISHVHFADDEDEHAKFAQRVLLTASNLVLTISTWQQPLQDVLSWRFLLDYSFNYSMSILLSCILLLCWMLFATIVSAMYQRLTGLDERPSELESRLPVPLDGKC